MEGPQGRATRAQKRNSQTVGKISCSFVSCALFVVFGSLVGFCSFFVLCRLLFVLCCGGFGFMMFHALRCWLSSFVYVLFCVFCVRFEW